jgi:RimJ/RimL family protein N-acetyltransferase
MIRIEAFDPRADPGQVEACYRIYVAAQAEDDPDGPVLSPRVFRGWFSQGWSAEPREAALACAGDAGGPAGCCLLELPERDNTHLGSLTLLVAPGARRRGTGAALLRHAAGRAACHGRTLLSGEVRIGSAGPAFAAAMGGRGELIEVSRVLDVADVPAGKLARLRAAAEAAARGYSLLCWAGPVPDELLDQVLAVTAAMSDAPHSPGTEPDRVDAQQIRHRERRSAEEGVRRYSAAARCDSTGELAALTQLRVDSGDPAWGYQQFTAVTRPHRGHRLGLLVKVAMLQMLADAEPGLRRIVTGNADSNRHMIAINAELGFRVTGEWQTWQLEVAAAGVAR